MALSLNHYAKLNTGQIVHVIRYNVRAQFDLTRHDHVLIMHPGKFKNLVWVNTTDIVWHHIFEEVKDGNAEG